MDEWQLVVDAQAGSHEAFAQLVTRYDAFLRRLVAYYVGSGDVADAAQEIWLQVYRKLWQLEEGDRLRPWLKKVVFYQCVNFRKARQRRRRAETYLSTDAWIRLTECVAADGYRVDELLDRQETRKHVTRHLDALPADYGQMLRLRYLQNMAYKEIAALSGLPESTVKWRLHEAKRLLKARLMTLVKEGRERKWPK
ncbi:MAG TPA: RNA polymerase sigma factor [Symbiobacteriaceae bacterium]|nr:RNA polymerase sigma factor [Symbiobacteriaceae bacterium]